ncbi:hypothetical protein [Ruminococcus sp.]|jgi:small-conductance mechanosensitive channel|uniref:hypothetical protein n=1 Tax=Ruminococcus sp. TaxID=41978 RepID=UPI003FD7B54F
MNNEVISDISLFDSHPSNMTKYINDIIKVIEDIRAEGYEMYSVILERKEECEQMAAEANDRIQEVKRYAPEDSNEQMNDLNNRKRHCENKFNNLDKSQRQLDDIAQQCVQMQKTVEVLKENVQITNRAFVDTMKYYKEAK